MEKYKNKYRIKSARHPNWDYGNNTFYFITICTQNRIHFFGEIVETQNLAAPYKMELSKIGNIANDCWIQIPNHFPFVVLHNHIVMPNHVHGIIEIAKNDDGKYINEHNDVETQNFASLPHNQTHNQTHNKTKPHNQTKNKFGPQSKNLASIVRGFKIGVTKNAKQFNNNFKWQPRYHDHIIRDDESFYKISQYIENNPLNWRKDKFYK